MKVGVELIHTCGHLAYHTVDQQKTAGAYDILLGSRPCPKCLEKLAKRKKGGKR